jgi:membrane protein DedA with SNARE-associated domain
MHGFLDGLAEFCATHPGYAFWAIFLLALSEAIPIVGTVVPGSTLVLAISALAAKSGLSPWPLLVAATAGAIAGDGISYWLGRRYHQEILQRWPLNQFPQFIRRSEVFFERHGAASVFLARFTAVVRAFVPLIAGILNMPARQFYTANIVSALLWAPAHVFPGMAFGVLVSLAGASAQQILILVVAAATVGFVIFKLLRWRAGRIGNQKSEVRNQKSHAGKI